MTHDEKQQDLSMGPQGTQAFDKTSVHELLAAEIAGAQSESADTPALIGLSDNVSGQCHVLKKHKIEVGRRPNSDIIVDCASVSAMHAQMIQDGDHWKVLNLLSSNGTFVNGKKVAEQVLNVGDIVAFGGAEYVFTLIDDLDDTKDSNSSLPLILIGALLIVAFGAIFYFLL